MTKILLNTYWTWIYMVHMGLLISHTIWLNKDRSPHYKQRILRQDLLECSILEHWKTHVFCLIHWSQESIDLHCYHVVVFLVIPFSGLPWLNYLPPTWYQQSVSSSHFSWHGLQPVVLHRLYECGNNPNYWTAVFIFRGMRC